MGFDEDKFEHPEPERTRTRSEFPSIPDARGWLDKGGHLEHDDEALYRHMRESQRRLMVLLPTALWAGITHARETQKFDIAEDITIALERGASVALRWLKPDTAEATVVKILGDGERLITAMDGDTTAQGVLGVCYLILALADRNQLPDPTAQCVLSAMAIVEEAQNDAQAGIWGTWGWNEAKADKMVNKGVDRLMLSGYL